MKLIKKINYKKKYEDKKEQEDEYKERNWQSGCWSRFRSQKTIQKALELAKKTGNSNLIGAAYNNLGNSEIEKGNKEKASEYYKLGLELSQEYGDLAGVSTGYNNLGYMFYAVIDFMYCCFSLSYVLAGRAPN